MNLVSYLKHLCTHLTSRAPLSTQLHGESLSILCKHPHLDRVNQHGHNAQTLLLDGVEHNQVPGREEGKKQSEAQDGREVADGGDERSEGMLIIPRPCWVQLD